MSKIIDVPTRPYNDRLFLRKTVEFNPGMTVLVGCNGSGKSTLMRFVKYALQRNKDILILEYDDRKEGGDNLISFFAWKGDMAQMANMWMKSEGERIIHGVGTFAASIRSKIRSKKPKEIWILLDTVGSGLSIDGIRQIKVLKDTILEDNAGCDVYFVVSTNEYEFAKGEDCIDVTTFKHMHFSDYEQYSDYIMKTSKKKERRYKRAMEE